MSWLSSAALLSEIRRAVSPRSATKASSSRSPELFSLTWRPPRSAGASVISRSRRSEVDGGRAISGPAGGGGRRGRRELIRWSRGCPVVGEPGALALRRQEIRGSAAPGRVAAWRRRNRRGVAARRLFALVGRARRPVAPAAGPTAIRRRRRDRPAAARSAATPREPIRLWRPLAWTRRWRLTAFAPAPTTPRRCAPASWPGTKALATMTMRSPRRLWRRRRTGLRALARKSARSAPPLASGRKFARARRSPAWTRRRSARRRSARRRTTRKQRGRWPRPIWPAVAPTTPAGPISPQGPTNARRRGAKTSDAAPPEGAAAALASRASDAAASATARLAAAGALLLCVAPGVAVRPAPGGERVAAPCWARAAGKGRGKSGGGQARARSMRRPPRSWRAPPPQPRRHRSQLKERGFRLVARGGGVSRARGGPPP